MSLNSAQKKQPAPKKSSTNNASFDDAVFGENTSFYATKFFGGGSFSSSSIGEKSNFRAAVFNVFANFNSCEIKNNCDFSLSRFECDATYIGASFGRDVKFERCRFKENADFSAETEGADSKGRSSFKKISFAGSVFHKDVFFSDRKFTSTTDFGCYTESKNPARSPHERLVLLEFPEECNTHFHGIPMFHGCEIHRDTTFEDAIFLSSPSPEAARAYRTLKESMEKFKAVAEERIFFNLERQAEKKKLANIEKFASAIYDTCSSSGLSMWRPISTLLITSSAIGFAHYGLSTIPTELGSDGFWKLTKYIALNTFPVPGFDKTQMELRDALFNKDGYASGAALGLEMIHKVISVGCAFLLGLALRNLFKMKS